MVPNEEKGSPYYGKIPVTPIMDFQIDNITIHQLLIPLRKKLLQELQRKVLNNKPEDFLEIYLTIFILLHNMELTIKHDRWFATRYSMQVWHTIFFYSCLAWLGIVTFFLRWCVVGRLWLTSWAAKNGTEPFLKLPSHRRRLSGRQHTSRTLPPRQQRLRTILGGLVG